MYPTADRTSSSYICTVPPRSLAPDVLRSVGQHQLRRRRRRRPLVPAEGLAQPPVALPEVRVRGGPGPVGLPVEPAGVHAGPEDVQAQARVRGAPGTVTEINIRNSDMLLRAASHLPYVWYFLDAIGLLEVIGSSLECLKLSPALALLEYLT